MARVTAAAKILFGGGELRDADAATLAMVTGEVPSHTVGRGGLDGGMPIIDALVATGLAASKGDANVG